MGVIHGKYSRARRFHRRFQRPLHGRVKEFEIEARNLRGVIKSWTSFTPDWASTW